MFVPDKGIRVLGPDRLSELDVPSQIDFHHHHIFRPKPFEREQFSTIQSEGMWPKPAEVVPITCVLKTGKQIFKPGEVRPVALQLAVYSILSSVRYGQLERWSTQWPHELALGWDPR